MAHRLLHFLHSSFSPPLVLVAFLPSANISLSISSVPLGLDDTSSYKYGKNELCTCTTVSTTCFVKNKYTQYTIEILMNVL